MDEDQEKKRMKGWKINLYPLKKTPLPFPPSMHLIVNK